MDWRGNQPAHSQHPRTIGGREEGDSIIDELISSLPTTLIPFAIVVYFWNQNNLAWMKERKELAEAVLAERKELAALVLSERAEWLQERRDMLERQFAAMDRMTTELAATRNENHAMRNRLQELMSRLEIHFFGRTGKSANGQ